MANKLWMGCCLLIVLVTGCGGSAKAPEARSPSGGSAFESAPPGYGAKTANIPPIQAPSAGPSTAPSDSAERSATVETRSPSAPAPEPTSRPGLGTEWGEARNSRVHDVSFTRAEADRPFALASLFYNDRKGVEAMANFHASNARTREFSTAGGAITVAIHDGSGESLEAVHVADRTYVVGRSGERYTIVLTNHTDHRFEAVGTVDGLDVINGKAGSMANRGYILMPFATLEIDGFRQSKDAVAAFRFAAVSDSYAAQMGAARNVGVIGVAFFTESGDRFDPWTDGEVQRRETANPFPATNRFARPPR